jgi:hypothetical protein
LGTFAAQRANAWKVFKRVESDAQRRSPSTARYRVAQQTRYLMRRTIKQGSKEKQGELLHSAGETLSISLLPKGHRVALPWREISRSSPKRHRGLGHALTRNGRVGHFCEREFATVNVIADLIVFDEAVI